MIIRKINAYRNDLSRVIIYFEDKSYITVLAERAKNLKVGDDIGAETLSELSEESKKSAARATAARIVGHSSMSCATLLRKLKEKGISEEDANDALLWLVELGIMDDAKYAQMLLNHYRNRGFGNRRISDEMRKRGIPREVVSEVLDECDMRSEILEFIQKKTRGVKPDEKQKAKIINALLRNGHSYDAINTAFRDMEYGG